MTDNDACYRSRLRNDAPSETTKHGFSRPCRHQTNGKGEQFNRTLALERAYAGTFFSDEERPATYADWIREYNYHRPQTGIGGLTPSERVQNLMGDYNKAEGFLSHHEAPE